MACSLIRPQSLIRSSNRRRWYVSKPYHRSSIPVCCQLQRPNQWVLNPPRGAVSVRSAYPATVKDAPAVGDVMKCFDTPNQLPVIYQLANDSWSATSGFRRSGPTWPNRFFLHGASSGGWDDSPTTGQMVAWETVDGFVYPSKASIFDRLNSADLGWRIYADEDGPIAGAIPQVAALHGITWKTMRTHFRALRTRSISGHPYTFIGPNYGDSGSSYEAAPLSTPMDGVHGGEALIKERPRRFRTHPSGTAAAQFTPTTSMALLRLRHTRRRASPGDRSPNQPSPQQARLHVRPLPRVQVGSRRVPR
jgi:hypothetical protein